MLKKIIYLVGPTNSGKTTISKELELKYGYSKIQSTTTRDIRDTENSDSMNFISKEEFIGCVNNCEFLEYDKYSNNMYGTLKSDVNRILNDSVIAVKVIEIKGLLSILKSELHTSNDIDFSIVYIKPSFEVKPFDMDERNDLNFRLKEDLELFETFLSKIFSNDEYKGKVFVIENKGGLIEVSSKINKLCLFSCDDDFKAPKSMLEIPDFVELNKVSEGSEYAVKFLDRYGSSLKQSSTELPLYLHSKEPFNLLRYVKEVFSDTVQDFGSDYVIIQLRKYGMTAVVTKVRR